VNDLISLIEVCYTIENSLHPFRTQNISSEVCITVGVYGSMFDTGFTSSGGYSSGGSGSSGGDGSTGSNSFLTDSSARNQNGGVRVGILDI
jgi:hypothetical protein